jgi:hypothetical protein
VISNLTPIAPRGLGKFIPRIAHAENCDGSGLTISRRERSSLEALVTSCERANLSSSPRAKLMRQRRQVLVKIWLSL